MTVTTSSSCRPRSVVVRRIGTVAEQREVTDQLIVKQLPVQLLRDAAKEGGEGQDRLCLQVIR